MVNLPIVMLGAKTFVSKGLTQPYKISRRPICHGYLKNLRYKLYSLE